MDDETLTGEFFFSGVSEHDDDLYLCGNCTHSRRWHGQAVGAPSGSGECEFDGSCGCKKFVEPDTSEPGQRFEVVGPENNEPDLTAVTLRSLDGSSAQPRLGMELMVPDAANLKVLRGVPIEQVRAITLDGARWIAISRPQLSLPPGQGKVLTAVIVEAKGLEAGAAITVGVGQIVAFTTSLSPTR